MTLRKLGRSAKELTQRNLVTDSSQDALLKEIKRLNDYMALMTNEPLPPTEHDDTDEIT